MFKVYTIILTDYPTFFPQQYYYRKLGGIQDQAHNTVVVVRTTAVKNQNADPDKTTHLQHSNDKSA